METKEEYYCSTCNSQVDENDSICKNCGSDLTEIIIESGWSRFKGKILSFISKFGKYHRVSYYFFLGPLLILVTSILLGIIGIAYYEFLEDTVERLELSYIFDYFSYLLTSIPYVLPVFVYTHLYLNVELKLKLFITLSVIIILFLCSLLLQYIGLNTFGLILLSIILLEIAFIQYSHKEYLILSIAAILFLGWFEFLSLGDLPRETVIRDYDKITEPLNVLKSKVDIITVPYEYEKYDMVIPYIIITSKDTLQLVLNYNKVRSVSIPSQHWELMGWQIDSVLSTVYYYPKPNI